MTDIFAPDDTSDPLGLFADAPSAAPTFQPGSVGIPRPSSPLLSTAGPARAVQQVAGISPLPSILGFANSAPSRTQSIVRTQPGNVSALTNKWQDEELLSAVAQLSPVQRQALIDLDAERVSRGSTPLTRDDTIRTVQTLVANRPATPAPERSVWNLPGNLVSNLGDIVKSIPKLPGAVFDQVSNLGTIPDTYDNHLANVLSAPGINLIPGTYILSQLARGGDGAQELARNPLFTALDVLPAASAIAGSTDVAKVARTAAEAGDALGTTRPLMATLTRRLDDAGNLQLNRAGEMGRFIRDETRVGQAVDAAFGSRARELAREQGRLQNRANAIRDGVIDDGTTETGLLQRSQQLRDRADTLGWDEAQRARIARIAQSVDNTPLSQLTPDELAYINEARDLAASYGNLLADRGELGRVLFPDGSAEFYDVRKANQFNRTQTELAYAQRLADVRQTYLSDQSTLGAIDPTRLDDLVNWVETVPKKQRSQAQRAVDAYVEAYGYDARAFRRQLKTINAGDRPSDLLPPRADLMPTDELVRTLQTFRLPGGQVDEHAYALARALASRDVQTIRREAQTLANRTAKASPAAADPRFTRTLQSLARRYGADTLIGDPTKTIQRANRRLQQLTADNAPARFQPLLASNRDTAVAARAQAASEAAIGRQLTPDEVARVAQVVQEQSWAGLEALGIPADSFRRLHSNTTREVVGTWSELKAAGVDPVFVHSTSTSRARSLDNPQITTEPNTLSQTKSRRLDISQGISDLGVSLSQQGMEILTRNLRTEFRDWVGAKYGIPQSQLMDAYLPQARALAASDPRLSVRGHLERIIAKSYRDLDEAFTGPGMGVYRDKVYVPNAIAENLKPQIPKPLTAAVNPITGTFRVAVTSLSIRNLLYNAIGGAVMVAGESPGALGYLGRARELIQNPQRILSDELRASLGGLGKDIREQLATRPDITASTMAGRTLGRMVEEAASVRQSGVGRAVAAVSNRSVQMNGMMDDMYRVAAYLSAEGKALRKGMSAEAAERAGLELARKVMMDYTSLTPFERSTMRALFPFYSFTSHVMRYVMRYPFDHPLRASIIASLGQAEVEDSQLLPQSFLSSFIFGRPGDEKRVDVGASNPFGDAANMFTLAGFMSATNPVIATALESVGIIQGEAELYPTLRYDPETGRLSATRGNPLLAFLENTIPQTQVLTSLLGVNAEFRERMTRDPEGASRMLMSSVGLPVGFIPRDVNVVGEVAKAEAARYDSQQNALNAALKTGNWGEAARYPGLSDEYEQMLSMTPSQLAAYMPQGSDIYAAMIEQATARQQRQAVENQRMGT